MLTFSQKIGIFLAAIIVAALGTLPFLLENPQSSTAAPGNTFRVEEYFIPIGAFSGTSYELTLNQDLSNNYFVIVQGSSGNGSSGTDRSPNDNNAALTEDPFGTGDLGVSSSSDTIGLSRNTAFDPWVGVVTVVECLTDCINSGFQMLDIQRVPHNGILTGGVDSSDVPWSDINQVMLMGGFNGAGCTSAESGSGNSKVCHVHIFPSNNNLINWTRSNVGATLSDAMSTVIVIEWGSEWSVQRVNIVGAAGGAGANTPGEYNTAAISPVNRANTWVWGTGHTSDQGIGDAAEGTLITLGNGVDQNVTESTLAIGQEYSDTKDFEVYSLTHPDLATDYRFKPDNDSNSLTVDVDVDPATDSTARMSLVTNGCNGTGNAYPRPMFSARYLDNDTVRLERRRSGQPFPAWVQGIDFSGIFPAVDLTNSSKTDDDGDDIVIPNQTVTYSITLSNSGTQNGTGIDVVDTIDSNLENLNITSITDCGSPTDLSTSTILNLENVTANIGIDCVITFETTVKAGLSGGTVINNFANISAANEGGSPFTLNSPSLTVAENTDLSVTKTAFPLSASPNEEITFTVTITNTGPVDGMSISLIDVIPGGLSYISDTPSQGSYDENSGIWDVGDILNGNSANLIILASIDQNAGASITNTGTISNVFPPDFTSANNTDSVTITVIGGGSGGGGRNIRGLGEVGYCGDGLLDDDEECDDGNNLDGDGCSALCREEEPPSAEIESEAEEQDTSLIPSSTSDCPFIDHPQVCENLSFLFEDPYGNVRREPAQDLRAAADEGGSCLSFESERELNFSDLNAFDSANPFIEGLKKTRSSINNKYIFSGTGPTTFEPNGPLTREAIVKTILVAHCLPIPAQTPLPENGFRFSDLNPSTETARIMYSAYQAGVIQGYTDGSARPNRLVSYAEATSMLLRAAEIEEESPGITWYQRNLDLARNNGISNDIFLTPDDIVTRRLFAKLLARSMAFSKNSEIYRYMERLNLKELEYTPELPTHQPLLNSP